MDEFLKTLGGGNDLPSLSAAVGVLAGGLLLAAASVCTAGKWAWKTSRGLWWVGSTLTLLAVRGFRHVPSPAAQAVLDDLAGEVVVEGGQVLTASFVVVPCEKTRTCGVAMGKVVLDDELCENDRKLIWVKARDIINSVREAEAKTRQEELAKRRLEIAAKAKAARA